MLLSAPGIGKTTFTLGWAAQGNLRTLYNSADTDQMTVSEQLSSLATGHPRDVVLQRLMRSKTWRLHYAEAVRHRFPNLIIDYSSAPRLSTVGEKLEALTEMWGALPQVVAFDTASDVVRSSDEPSGWFQQWLACRELAREFRCVVVSCHHLSKGPRSNGDVAPRLSDGMYGADRFPEIVLGFHQPNANEFVVSVLKNRGGPRGMAVRLRAELGKARFEDIYR